MIKVIAALVGLLALSLIDFELPTYNETVSAIFDAGHLGAYACFSFLVFRVLGERADSKKYCGIATALIVIAALIESIQPQFHRGASLHDAVFSAFGVLVGTGAAAAFRFRWSRALYISHFLLSLVFISIVSLPIWHAWNANLFRANQFPILGDFEDSREFFYWKAYGGTQKSKASMISVKLHATRGEHSISIRMAPGAHSGVEFYPAGQDWSGYRELSFDVYNSGVKFQGRVRIDDVLPTGKFKERFNTEFPLKSGANRISISLDDVRQGPVNRELDMTRIKRVFLFQAPSKYSRVIFLDNMRLEK